MKELIDRLNEMVEAGEKKNTLEESIGLPLNSLSAVLKGQKEMPKSWIPKIEEFLAAPIAEPHIDAPSPKTQMRVTKAGELTLAPSKESLQKMKETMDKLNKDFGDGTVMLMGDKTGMKTDVIPTGSLTLDDALGVGGFPRGRIIEIYGMESSGKTTIAIHAIAEAQRMGGKCAVIDAEHAFDPDYATAIGVNIDDLFISQPDYGEQALQVADELISTGAYAIVLVDSVAALTPKAEMEGQMGDSKMGLHARLMSQALRKLTSVVSKTGTILIMINQLREKIGVIYGSPYVTTGGNALKFYASVRLDVSKSGKLMNGEEQLGNKTKVKVVKNKVAPPFKVAEFDIVWGEGIDRMGEVVDLASENNIIQKSGSWYSYNGDKLGQGKSAVCGLLKDNPEMLAEIEAKIKEIE